MMRVKNKDVDLTDNNKKEFYIKMIKKKKNDKNSLSFFSTYTTIFMNRCKFRTTICTKKMTISLFLFRTSLSLTEWYVFHSCSLFHSN